MNLNPHPQFPMNLTGRMSRLSPGLPFTSKTRGLREFPEPTSTCTSLFRNDKGSFYQITLGKSLLQHDPRTRSTGERWTYSIVDSPAPPTTVYRLVNVQGNLCKRSFVRVLSIPELITVVNDIKGNFPIIKSHGQVDKILS